MRMRFDIVWMSSQWKYQAIIDLVSTSFLCMIFVFRMGWTQISWFDVLFIGWLCARLLLKWHNATIMSLLYVRCSNACRYLYIFNGFVVRYSSFVDKSLNLRYWQMTMEYCLLNISLDFSKPTFYCLSLKNSFSYL